MQDLDVAPGSLDPVAAALRAVDDGAIRLARAIVCDLVDGLGGDDPAADLVNGLPQVVELLARQATVLGERLGGAAGAYRRADWLARLAMGDPR